MNINDLFQKICEDPESDELRLEYARLIEPSDPDHAELIRFQIEVTADRRRGTRYYGLETKERHLLEANQARWARNIAKFTPHGQTEQIEFDRGFPAQIEMQPAVFAEYADFIFRLAPIRHIDFIRPLDEDGHLLCGDDGTPVPFPIDQVLACPQLSRLDSIGFVNVTLKPSHPGVPGDVTKIARCPHLTRCVSLNFAFTVINTHGSVELAQGELTGKMLVVVHPLTMGERHFQTYDEHGDEYIGTEFPEEWRDLERRLGYIPWLHPSHNGTNRFDARWHLEHGKLPKYPPGSPPKDEWYQVPRIYKAQTW
ncbi:MAG TPA: hypothetical protein VN253_19145 [Kofleriaceae bacterium]|nr:hypothetical protein [Kofleriaceae bacterium]